MIIIIITTTTTYSSVNGFSTTPLMKLTQIKSNIVVCGEGKTGEAGEKPLGAEKRTNKLNPHMTPSLGIEPGPLWWEASALTTAPSLLPGTSHGFLIVINNIHESLTKAFQRLDWVRTRQLIPNRVKKVEILHLKVTLLH